jgi:hypothetical protein
MTRTWCTFSAIALAAAIVCATAYERTSAQAGAPNARTVRAGVEAAPGQRAAAAPPAAPAGTWQPTKRKDGQPDIEGYYQTVNGGGSGGLNIEPLDAPWLKRTSPGIVIDPPDGLIPYLPWARARRDEVRNNQDHPTPGVVDSRTRGWPDGTPRINFYYINPFQILQPAGAIVMLYEAQNEFRYVTVDGRPNADSGVKLWMGSSRGRWEGNTLVVETTGMSEKMFYRGQPVANMRLIERYTRIAPNKVEWSTTMDDSTTWTRPFTFSFPLTEDNQQIIFEYACHEGNFGMANILTAARTAEKAAGAAR